MRVVMNHTENNKINGGNFAWTIVSVNWHFSKSSRTACSVQFTRKETFNTLQLGRRLNPAHSRFPFHENRIRFSRCERKHSAFP